MRESIRDSVLGLMRESAYNPLDVKELCKIFSVGKADRDIFLDILKDLEQEGLIFKTKKDRYGVPEKMNMKVGRLTVHPRGFGFVLSNVEGEEDLFIPSEAMQDAMHNDKVIARIVKMSENGKRMEGEIVRVIEREITQVVGRYEASKDFGFVVPDNKKITKDIFISKRDSMKAKTGEIVVCKITKWAKKNRSPEGEIIEILGKKGDPGVDILSIIRQNNLPEDFPKKVLSEVEGINETIEQEEIEKRRDLRNEKIFTIDGADAKDLDDAISIKKLDNGNYLLGVHIADVTHYVKERKPLDKEALKRATSVYLVNQVIPMLPKKLSNGVCSLHPAVDRLTLSVSMEIDKKGKVVKHEIFESVINSKARMVYEDVSDILENEDADLKKKYEDLIPDFLLSNELAKILMERRRSRGAMNFEFPESKIIINEKTGLVDYVGKYERRIANKIIEEFMLVCNETVAEQFFFMKMPFVYRIHENPSGEKIQELSKFLSTFGYRIKGDTEEIHPKSLQAILDEIEGKKEELVISTLMLRSLKQARYSPECSGHFGLAAKYYSHFTSPIRRYPDLQIHRIIKEVLRGSMNEGRIEQLKPIVANASEQSSLKEREAEEAERQVENLKKAEYMSKRIGEEYDGIISSVTSFGIFVELDNTIEGLIRLNTINDDYYIFDAENYQLIGEHRKRMFRIGDEVKIRVDSVSIEMREINFVLV